MATAETEFVRSGVVYDLKGTLLEACSCGVLCPCWVGENPDEGTCDAINAYHFTAGVIGDIDVGGLSIVNIVHIPGNVLAPGSWKVATFIDDRATDEQFTAIVNAYHGKLGGPLADIAGLIGEIIALERAPIRHRIAEGKGSLEVGDFVSAEMEPYKGPDGSVTTLRDSLFSTVPGSPAYVSKSGRNMVNLPRLGMVWSFENRNAIQSDYRITFAG